MKNYSPLAGIIIAKLYMDAKREEEAKVEAAKKEQKTIIANYFNKLPEYGIRTSEGKIVYALKYINTILGIYAVHQNCGDVRINFFSNNEYVSIPQVIGQHDVDSNGDSLYYKQLPKIFKRDSQTFLKENRLLCSFSDGTSLMLTVSTHGHISHGTVVTKDYTLTDPREKLESVAVDSASGCMVKAYMQFLQQAVSKGNNDFRKTEERLKNETKRAKAELAEQVEKGQCYYNLPFVRSTIGNHDVMFVLQRNQDGSILAGRFSNHNTNHVVIKVLHKHEYVFELQHNDLIGHLHPPFTGNIVSYYKTALPELHRSSRPDDLGDKRSGLRLLAKCDDGMYLICDSTGPNVKLYHAPAMDFLLRKEKPKVENKKPDTIKIIESNFGGLPEICSSKDSSQKYYVLKMYRDMSVLAIKIIDGRVVPTRLHHGQYVILTKDVFKYPVEETSERLFFKVLSFTKNKNDTSRFRNNDVRFLCSHSNGTSTIVINENNRVSLTNVISDDYGIVDTSVSYDKLVELFWEHRSKFRVRFDGSVSYIIPFSFMNNLEGVEYSIDCGKTFNKCVPK